MLVVCRLAGLSALKSRLCGRTCGRAAVGDLKSLRPQRRLPDGRFAAGVTCPAGRLALPAREPAPDAAETVTGWLLGSRRSGNTIQRQKAVSVPSMSAQSCGNSDHFRARPYQRFSERRSKRVQFVGRCIRLRAWDALRRGAVTPLSLAA